MRSRRITRFAPMKPGLSVIKIVLLFRLIGVFIAWVSFAWWVWLYPLLNAFDQYLNNQVLTTNLN